ncbi:MAG: hypothetical protein O7C65_02270, partial [Planctomycetota bacterium]|nr:hypothetical protein [Planctomycetota bacterium]
ADFIEVVETGPRDALTAGFAADLAGFKDAFYGAGANATDAEVQAFIDELRNRYGEFTGSRLDQQGGSAQPAFGQPNVPFPYVLEFEDVEVRTEVEVVFADPASGPGFINKLGYIKVFDDDAGDLTYPPPPADEGSEDAE